MNDETGRFDEMHYTAEQAAIVSAAYKVLRNDIPAGLDDFARVEAEKVLDDRLNNVWSEEVTAAELVARVRSVGRGE